MKNKLNKVRQHKFENKKAQDLHETSAWTRKKAQLTRKKTKEDISFITCGY